MASAVICFDATERDCMVAFDVNSRQMLELMNNVDGRQSTRGVARGETVDVLPIVTQVIASPLNGVHIAKSGIGEGVTWEHVEAAVHSGFSSN